MTRSIDDNYENKFITEDEAMYVRELNRVKIWNKEPIVIKRLDRINKEFHSKLAIFKRVYSEEATLEDIIKAKCMECSIMDILTVKACDAVDCPLWGMKRKLFSPQPLANIDFSQRAKLELFKQKKEKENAKQREYRLKAKLKKEEINRKGTVI